MNQHGEELTVTDKNKSLKTLDLAIGVRVPASQPIESNKYGRLEWAARRVKLGFAIVA
jgi:hypothetical protein